MLFCVCFIFPIRCWIRPSSKTANISTTRTESSDCAAGKVGEDGKVTFPELQDIVGFPGYYAAEKKYAAD